MGARPDKSSEKPEDLSGPLGVMLQGKCKVFENGCFLIVISRHQVVCANKWSHKMEWTAPIRNDTDLIGYLMQAKNSPGMKSVPND